MKKVTLIFALMLASSATFAQDATVAPVVEPAAPTSTPLEISGSGDLYYKYDFAKAANIGTSFASDQNSLSLGMIDIALKKKTGRSSFVGELSFGPRGQSQSIPNAIGNSDETSANSFHIQNLYASYEVTNKLSLTAGYMGTFVGYEVISPLGNFNYSTSYLFTNGPFQNAGVKANYKITDKFGIMLGAFNDTWNNYKANSINGLSTIGGQFSYTTSKVSAYLNVLDGSASGTIIDLTSSVQFTEKFKLGLNAAYFEHGTALTYSHKGAALYPVYAFTNTFALGLRAEYYRQKYDFADAREVAAFTLTGNFKTGGLTFIPEFRVDNNADKGFGFVNSSGSQVTSASQFLLAMVYGF